MFGLLLGIVLRRRRDSPGGKETFGRAVISGLRRRRKRRNTWKAGPFMRAPCETGTVRRWEDCGLNMQQKMQMLKQVCSADTLTTPSKQWRCWTPMRRSIWSWLCYSSAMLCLTKGWVQCRVAAACEENTEKWSFGEPVWRLKPDFYALIMRGGFRWNGARCSHKQKIWLKERIDVILR